MILSIQIFPFPYVQTTKMFPLVPFLFETYQSNVSYENYAFLSFQVPYFYISLLMISLFLFKNSTLVRWWLNFSRANIPTSFSNCSLGSFGDPILSRIPFLIYKTFQRNFYLQNFTKKPTGYLLQVNFCSEVFILRTVFLRMQDEVNSYFEASEVKLGYSISFGCNCERLCQTPWRAEVFQSVHSDAKKDLLQYSRF